MMGDPRTPEGIRRAARLDFEIPVHLDRLRVTPRQPLVDNILHRSPSLPPIYLSPALSPDELVIQQRGRRRLPVTWSPDIDLKWQSSLNAVNRTPPKNPSSRMSPLKRRQSPRKRLILDDIGTLPTTPEKHETKIPAKDSPNCKRQKIECKLNFESNASLDSALKGLTSIQLVNMIKGIVEKYPKIGDEILSEMPAPDLAPYEEKLKYLKSNIFKSLPKSRLSSKTDSPAFSRVATHLAAFKKCVVEQGKILVESQHWMSIVDYVSLTWSYVRALPVWDNTPHNDQRKQSFKALTNFCMIAMKKGVFDKGNLLDLQSKLQGLAADSDEVQSCLVYIDSQLQAL